MLNIFNFLRKKRDKSQFLIFNDPIVSIVFPKKQSSKKDRSTKILLKRFVKLYKSTKYDKALIHIEKIILIDPVNAGYLSAKGVILYKLGHKEDALNCFNKSVKLNSEYAPAWHNISCVWGHLEKFDKSLETSDKAFNLNHRLLCAMENKIASLYKLGRLKECLKISYKILQSNSNSPKIWFTRSLANRALGRLKNALNCINKTISLEPNYANIWLIKSSIYTDINEPKKALVSIDKAIRLAPDYPQAWDQKGIVLTRLNNYEEALKAHDKALKIDPCYATALSNKCYILTELEMFNDAISICDNAIDVDKNCALAWYNRACVFAIQSYKKQALSDLERAINLNNRLLQSAKKDKDFVTLKDDKDFLKIVTTNI